MVCDFKMNDAQRSLVVLLAAHVAVEPMRFPEDKGAVGVRAADQARRHARYHAFMSFSVQVPLQAMMW